jgi:hypothetical protein
MIQRPIAHQIAEIDGNARQAHELGQQDGANGDKEQPGRAADRFQQGILDHAPGQPDPCMMGDGAHQQEHGNDRFWRWSQ